MRAFTRVDVAQRRPVEALDRRAEARQMLLLAARGDGRQRPAVKGAVEGDQTVTLGIALMAEVLARHLDGALHRLGARIAKEHPVGEGGVAQPLGQTLLTGDPIDVRHMPELAWPAR